MNYLKFKVYKHLQYSREKTIDIIIFRGINKRMIEISCTKQFDASAKWAALEISSKPEVNPYFTVSSILMVGALLYEEKSKLGVADMLFLDEIITNAMVAGIRFDTTNVSVCNLEYGNDFVEETPKVDLLMLCYINKAEMWPKRGWSFGMESPLLREGETWEGALKKSASSLIAVNGIGATSIEQHDIPTNYSAIEMPQADYTTRLFRNSDLSL